MLSLTAKKESWILETLFLHEIVFILQAITCDPYLLKKNQKAPFKKKIFFFSTLSWDFLWFKRLRTFITQNHFSSNHSLSFHNKTTFCVHFKAITCLQIPTEILRLSLKITTYTANNDSFLSDEDDFDESFDDESHWGKNGKTLKKTV